MFKNAIGVDDLVAPSFNLGQSDSPFNEYRRYGALSDVTYLRHSDFVEKFSPIWNLGLPNKARLTTLFKEFIYFIFIEMFIEIA